jgi:putative PEP-CTERM system TPR-repeat lipoprotein
MQRGDASSAQATLQKSVQLAPSQAGSGEALVAAALSAGDLDGADAALERLRAKVGDTEATGILSGMVRLGRLDLDGGRAAFANTLKQFPESVGAKLNLAKVLTLQGRRADGEGLLKDILAKDPGNITALNTLVQLQVGEGQFQPAIQAVETARAAAPENVAFTAILSDLLVRANDPRRALGMLQAMRDTAELPPVLMGAMARAQLAAGMNDEAKRTYREILTANPTDLEARRAQVDLLLKLRETDAAKESLRAALEKSPGNIGIMSSIVTLDGQSGGIDGAVRTAEELRRNPANLPSSTVLKGDVLMQGKRYADAAQAFLDENKLAPTGPLALRLANAQVSAGRDDDGSRTLREWLKRTPDDVDAAQMLALLDIKAKRFPDAERNLQHVLSKRPSDTVALNNMAWILGQKSDPRARSMAQRAYLQSPSPETADTLGWIMVQQGEAKGGLSLLQQASTQRPADPSVKYHLAVALKNNGQKDEATKLLQPLLAGGDFDDKGAARKLFDEIATVTR